MNDVAVLLAIVVPALSLVPSGVLLLPTRSRPAGALLLMTSVGVIVAAVALLIGEDDVATVVLLGSLVLPGAMALLAYPRACFRQAVDFCSWIVVAATGVLAVTQVTRHPGLSGSLAVVTMLALIGHGWWVLETGDDDDRLATLWLALAVGTTGCVFALLSLQFGSAGTVAGAVALSAIGPAMVIGVRRPDRTDVRGLVVRVVVFAVVALTYVSVFAGLVAIVEVTGSGDPSPTAVAFIGLVLALGVHPLQVVLRGLIDEVLFGDRPDPLLAATAVADQIGDDPLLALRAIRGALALPYASISAGGVVLATSGTSVTETRRLPLSLGDDTVGEMVIGLRPGELALSAGDEQVLRIVAPLVAQTLRSRRLADDLKESRTAAIAAIEEERRRLRRDLHDGLGPTLSGIAFTADAARNTISSDPAAADALLLRLRADAGRAVGEIRRLVYDMRPPALDELGLVPALRQQVASIRTSEGQPMQVELDATDLPPLPAAVEVAAFRIATEAVMNSARHSRTNRAWVTIDDHDGLLRLTIRDAGSGGGAWTPGVGLSSMRERAAEVGGTLELESNGGGSIVRATLPIG